MDMHFVDSTNIEAIGYDAGTMELHVQFRNGRTYVYFDVDEWRFSEMLNAESKGSFLNREIKPNYRCEER